MIRWLSTAPNPRSPATGYDAGQRGWRLHAVEVAPGERGVDIMGRRAACGLRPAHGWGIDLYIDKYCTRCAKKHAVEEEQ